MMKEILIVAGEYSGDLNASLFLNFFPKDLHFFGMGGRFLKNKGVEVIVDIENSIIGFQEAILNFHRVLNTVRKLIYEVRRRRVRYALLVDYPGFNLMLARHLKNLGVKVMYFIPPQIWAWGGWRVKNVKKYVDKVFVIFPFEERLFKKYGIDAVYVGNPVVWRLKDVEFFSVVEKDRFHSIGFLPGSRQKEIERLLPKFLKIKDEIKKNYSVNKFLISLVDYSFAEKYRDKLLDFEIYREGVDVIKFSDIVVAASGTVALECAFLERPFVSLYVLSELSWLLGKMLAKVKYSNLVNILLQRKLVDEFIQRIPPPKVVASLEKTWNNRFKILKGFEQIKKILLSVPYDRVRSYVENFLS